MSGKGDRPRPYNPKIFAQNYDSIFGKTMCKTCQKVQVAHHWMICLECMKRIQSTP